MTSDHRSRSATSRRGFLVGAGLAVVCGGGGVAAGLLVDRSADEPHTPNPTTLRAAAQAERDLLHAVDGALSAGSSLGPQLRQVRADHVAHLAALVAVIAGATGGASASPAPPSSVIALPARTMTAARLRALESAASAAAARRALALTGRDAALLASIAACEASHAELFA